MKCFHLITAAIGSIMLLMVAVPLNAQAPADWAVNPAGYEHFMTVTAELIIDDEAVMNENSVVAAFVGDECRGVAEPSIIENQTVFFLMVYGNAGETDMSFRAYYAPEDTVINLTDTLTFESGAAYGTPDEPYGLTGTLGISSIGETTTLVAEYQLFANYPNPFNPSTMIRLHLPHSVPVHLAVYNLRGTVVRTLVDRPMTPGDHTIHWDGRNSAGEQMSAGVYFYRIITPEFTATRKMLLVK